MSYAASIQNHKWTIEKHNLMLRLLWLLVSYQYQPIQKKKKIDD